MFSEKTSSFIFLSKVNQITLYVLFKLTGIWHFYITYIISLLLNRRFPCWI